MENYRKQYTFPVMADIMLRPGHYKKTKFTGTPGTADEDPVVLTKKNGKDFVILNITDNHFTDYDIRYLLGLIAKNTIKKLVAEVRPDLITVTGDMVCARSSYGAIRQFTDMMESFGIPWAPVFGNHDDETNCDLNYLCDIMLESPHCLLKKGDPSMRCGNYIVNINDENGRTVESLFMVDSAHSLPCREAEDMIIRRGREIGAEETAVFLHIPLADYQEAFDAAWDNERNCWLDGFGAMGENHEKICCERDRDGNPVQRGFLERIKGVPSLRHVICGHEHLNNWSLDWNGVRLTYTLKVGMGSGFRKEFNGGTVITVGDMGIKSIVHRTRKGNRFTDIGKWEAE